MQYIPSNPLTEGITQFVPSPLVEDLSSIAKKAMRFKIVADRYTRGFQKEAIKGPPGAFKTHGIFQLTNEERAIKIDQAR